MRVAARELWQWTVEHRWMLFLATVAAFSQLHYDQHGPPAHVLVLPFLAVSIFLAIPLAAGVVHDSKDRGASVVAAVGGTIAVLAPLWWAHAPGGRAALVKDALPIVIGALVGLALALMSAWKGRVPLSDWGLGFGDVRWWTRPVFLLLALIFVGIPLVAYFFPEFVAFYPRYKASRAAGAWWPLLQYNLAMGLYMFCWEFFFRGFMLFGLARTLGPAAAIVIQAYPFFLLHDSKPEPEMISSWFGGILMGWLCWRAKSAWPSFLLHWIMYATMEVSAFVLRYGI